MFKNKKGSERIGDLIMMVFILIIVAISIFALVKLISPWYDGQKISAAINTQKDLVSNIGVGYCASANSPETYPIQKKFRFPEEAFSYYTNYNTETGVTTLWLGFDRDKIDVEDNPVDITGCNMPIYLPKSTAQQEEEYQTEQKIEMGVNIVLIASSAVTLGGGLALKGATLGSRISSGMTTIKTAWTAVEAGEIIKAYQILKAGTTISSLLEKEGIKGFMFADAKTNVLNFVPKEEVSNILIHSTKEAGKDTIITVWKLKEAGLGGVEVSKMALTVNPISGIVTNSATAETSGLTLSSLNFLMGLGGKVIGVGSIVYLGYQQFTSGCKDVNFQVERCHCDDGNRFQVINNVPKYDQTERSSCAKACMDDSNSFGSLREVIALTKIKEEKCIEV